jgi:hypothetical protein
MQLNWDIDFDAEELQAASRVHQDQGTPMHYTVYPCCDDWAAKFEGVFLKTGTLGACLQACEESEAHVEVV